MTERAKLSDEMFLVTIEDDHTGVTMQTLSLSRTPTVLLSFAANRFFEAASDYFKEQFDVGSADWRMLFQLARYPGATAAASAKTLSIDKGTVSRSVQRMSKGGLIVAGDLHANGRSRGWYLTAQGRQIHDRILKAALERQSHLLHGFEPEEVRTMCELLTRFLRNLEKLEAPTQR